MSSDISSPALVERPPASSRSAGDFQPLRLRIAYRFMSPPSGWLRLTVSRSSPPGSKRYAATLMPMASVATGAPETVLLAAPRGYCAGVDRAVQTVEHALDLYGAPVYVRKEIVHNKHVVAELRERGAIFVDEIEDAIPEGAVTVFSAHGVSPAVHEDARRRGLRTIDATCPLVTKVHREALKFAADGYTIVLIGHA